MHTQTAFPLAPYDDLSREGKTLVEYVWIASSGCSQLRSKTRVLDHHPTCVEEVPMLVVEGSSDGSPSAEENELCLKPRKVFPDPFRGNGHLLVLCDSFVAQVPPPSEQLCSLPLPTLRPHPSNSRVPCQDVTAHAAPHMIAFAFQQEYLVQDPNVAVSKQQAVQSPALVSTNSPFTAPAYSQSKTSPLVSSSVTEAGVAELKPLSLAARKLAERHLMVCLRAGINISEISQRNSSVAPLDTPAGALGVDRAAASDGMSSPDVWTYKLGPNLGMDAADQLWMSRFLMLRASELDGLNVFFDPHGTGDPVFGMRCRTECSTEATRCPTSGLAELERHMALLHVAQLQYGPPQYAPHYPRTSYQSGGSGLRIGVGKSPSSALPLDVVIPTTTLLQGCGHWVDCRPASNADPYLIIAAIAATVLQSSARLPVPMALLQQQQQLPHLGSPKSILAHTLCSSASHASALHSYMDDSCSDWSLDESDDDNEMSTMNSEDVLIDELDRIDAGRTSSCDSFPAQPGKQQQRRRQRTEYDECCSSGSSPVLADRYAEQFV